ncbi:MAG: hypothetical protein NC350_01360 [Corallococcus sp.]|nr:hypothetical protein [Corallococcus sp.]
MADKKVRKTLKAGGLAIKRANDKLKLATAEKRMKKVRKIPFVNQDEVLTDIQTRNIKFQVGQFGALTSMMILLSLGFCAFVIVSAGFKLVFADNPLIITAISLAIWLLIAVFAAVAVWKYFEIRRSVAFFKHVNELGVKFPVDSNASVIVQAVSIKKLRKQYASGLKKQLRTKRKGARKESDTEL